MRRFISLILVIIMLISLCSVTVFAKNETMLSVGDIRYISSTQIEVPIIIENNHGIKGASFDIQCGESATYNITMDSVVKSDLYSDLNINYEFERIYANSYHGYPSDLSNPADPLITHGGPYIDWNVYMVDTHNIRVSMYDADHLYSSNGEICKLVFNLNESTYDENDNLPVSFSNGKIINARQQEETVSFMEQEYKIHNQFNIHFETNGGDVLSDKAYNYGTYITDIPIRDEYDFAGWYKDEALTEEWLDSDIVTSDMTLYAKWIPKTNVIEDINAYIYGGKCYVDFEVLSKETNQNNTALIQLNSENEQVAALRTYTFDSVAGETESIATEINLNDVTCNLGEHPYVSIMIWNPLAKGTNVAKMKNVIADMAHKITFSENYDGGQNYIEYVKNSSEFSLPSSNREGYTFDYWMTSSGARWEPGTEFTSDETLYACYSPITFNVKFHGANSNTTEQQVSYNSVLVSPDDRLVYIFR